ncbi:hypothetical protein ISS42_02920 [Candidatus Shapirobacteria bacterium]|nr:hypothetical protein [Candidatus Shapirobacteria bacterium]
MSDPTILFENNHQEEKEEEKQEAKLAIKSGAGVVIEVEKLADRYEASYKLPMSEGGATIHVDEVASRLAGFYEKLRRVIDWKEEHLIRRTAVERVLKRRLVTEISGLKINPGLEAKGMAEPLVLELVRAGHLPNDEIPKSRIRLVEEVLEKYIYILQNAPWSANHIPRNFKKKINFYNWLLEIAACEIEEVLDPPIKQKALISFMVNSLNSQIKVIPSGVMDENEKRIQVIIAVHRTLFHLDGASTSYHLFEYYYPEWTKPSVQIIDQAAKNIFYLWEQTEGHLSHPLSGEFFKLAERYDSLYLVLGDVLDNLNKEGEPVLPALSKKKRLKELVKDAYDKRLATLKGRLFRAAIYSTLSIFVAGGFSLFIIEVPVAKLFYGSFSLFAIAVDILVPSILMFALVALIKPPAKSNFKKVMDGVLKIVFPTTQGDAYEINASPKKRPIFSLIINFFYLVGSIFSLGLIFAVFYYAKIPPTSLFLDTLNVAVIVFAALVIKQRAKELTVEEKTSFWEFFIDMLSIPVAKIGQWLANKWKEYNVVSVFFTVLIDTPFMTLVDFVEGWSSFLKRKRGEIY